MYNVFNAIVAKTKVSLHDFWFKCSHRKKVSYFTRSTCRLTFPMTMGMILNLPKAAMQVEIHKFFHQISTPSKEVTAAAFLKARKKIAISAFFDIITDSLCEIYTRPFKTVSGCRVVAVDGSVFEVPQAAKKDYGTLTTSSVAVAKAQACALYDVENHIILEGMIAPYEANEREEAAELIQQLEIKSQAMGIKNLYVLDRGFPSKKLLRVLGHYPFVFRVGQNFMAAISKANLPDQIVTLEDDQKQKHQVRVVTLTLESGNTEKLFSNILDPSVTIEDFKEIYHKRWGIEGRYNVLKNLLDIDNFSGTEKEIIEQDFYATIFIANLIAVAQNYADEEVKEKNQDKNLKWEYKTNTNTTIGILRPMLIEAFMADPKKQVRLFRKVLRLIQESVVPIRPNRTSTSRTKKYASVKHPMNRKGNR